MKDCLDCQRWQDCIGKAWYEYADIRWCPYQVVWIWRNRVTLLKGRWVDNPDSSSYTDGGIQTSYSHEASFVKPELIIGEVEKRMESLTRDARDAFMDAVDKEYEIGDYSPPAYRVLMYLKGHRRKKVSYSEVQAAKNYHISMIKTG